MDPALAAKLATVDPVLLAMRDAPLAATSRRHYLSMMLVLQKLLNKSMYNIIMDGPDSIEKIKARYTDVNTRKTLVVAVKAAVKHDAALRARVPEERMTCWTEFFKEMKTKSIAQSMSGEKTERQRKTWVDWKDYLAARDRQEPYSKAHLLMCLYSMVPPLRHDYGNVRIFQRDEDVPAGYEDNYLVMGPKRFVLQKYKTRRSMGVYCAIWPVCLMRVIRETLRLHPRTYLFERSPGMPYPTSYDFKVFAHGMYNKVFGFPVGVNIVRHSYITSLDFNKLRPRELAAIASAMRHGLDTQQSYRLNFEPED